MQEGIKGCALISGDTVIKAYPALDLIPGIVFAELWYGLKWYEIQAHDTPWIDLVLAVKPCMNITK